MKKYEQTDGFDATCGLRKIADYARATSAAAATAACVLCLTAAMPRLSIDAMCVGRAVRCACGAVTRPKAESAITFFADRSRLQQNNTAHRAPASACCSSSQNTRRRHLCSICTLPRLHRMTLPAFGGPALAWPRCTGHAFGEVRVVASRGANHLPCNVRTYVT